MLSLSIRLLVQSMFFFRILILDSPKHPAFAVCTSDGGTGFQNVNQFEAFLPLPRAQFSTAWDYVTRTKQTWLALTRGSGLCGTEREIVSRFDRQLAALS